MASQSLWDACLEDVIKSSCRLGHGTCEETDTQGNWVDLQPHVLSIGLGDAGYNPYWDVNFVVVDPDSFTDVFKSENDILESGEGVIDSGFILLCQQISK